MSDSHVCNCSQPKEIHIIMRPSSRKSRRHTEVLYFLDPEKARAKCAELNRELIVTDVGLESQFYVDTRRFLDDGRLFSGTCQWNNDTRRDGDQDPSPSSTKPRG